MQAVWYQQNGEAADVLQFGELSTPIPGPGEVRVKLATSGVNPSDVKSRKARPLGAPVIIPHSDGAGIIDAVGDGINQDRIGQRVWIWNGQWQRPWGTAAQYIALPSAQAVLLPAHVQFDAAACFGIPVLTAIQAIHLAGALEGKTVLVTGAASAVGHYIAQLAVLAGATVFGTVGSVAKGEHARAAGVRELIFYKTESVGERVKALTQDQGVDVIIDLDFSTAANYLADGALKAHGTLVGYGSNIVGDVALNFRTLLWRSLTLKFFIVYDLTESDRAFGLQRLSQLLNAKSLRHCVGATFPLSQMALAHQAVEQGNVIGNVVVDVSQG
jgi:NADPH:quinone reductase